MQTLRLGDIRGVHPRVAAIEQAWDLAPIEPPDFSIVPQSAAQWISEIYPLVVSDHYCVGQTTLYRWLAANLPSETPVQCIEWSSQKLEKRAQDVVLVERLVTPALARITPQQVQDLYQKISALPDQWASQYRSHAHLASLVGVQPLKGRDR
jgi:hypothetical protein|tara:strand:- start:1734 stop:2189 length:456 start_codon:yes stop_codon:yes gene_type:complete